jgi:hypothetical protein
MCYIEGQKNKYSVLNECNRMLKYNIANKSSENVALSKCQGTALTVQNSITEEIKMRLNWGNAC